MELKLFKVLIHNLDEYITIEIEDYDISGAYFQAKKLYPVFGEVKQITFIKIL